MYVCRRLRVCNWLMNNGFVFIDERFDFRNPKFKVWLFEDSDALQKSISDYYNSDAFINRKAERV